MIARPLVVALVTLLGCHAAPPGRDGDAPAWPRPPGRARFTVLTPSLVRLEYAGDGKFEDRPGFDVVDRDFSRAAFTEQVSDGWRVVCTELLCVHYRESSGPFGSDNLYIEFRNSSNVTVRANPRWGVSETPGNLGGWYRALDGMSAGPSLHDGLLSRTGWYLLDDSGSALWQDGALVPPPDHHDYQSGYFFAYGWDYKHALKELARLTGPIPLLPRWAFGVWYSRYFPYTQSEYMNELVPRFRRAHVPLDVLVVDTDWKAPFDWNGWSWNPVLFPDPARFFAWARAQELVVTLNIHPSINRYDPRFAYMDFLAHGLYPIRDALEMWDWGDPRHLQSYFAAHEPMERMGVRFWWLDWCCEPARDSIIGTTPDTLINHQYAARSTAKGERGFAFSRIGSYYAGYGNLGETTPAGAWGEHRSTVHFTGDTQPTWQMLRYEAGFTAREGNILMSYVTHDIGSFHANHLSDELYLRWLELGTFQPILRLHSDHGDRLPWDYGDDTRRAAERLLRLRASLSAYLYTTARQSYDDALPIVRGLYLDHPNHREAYDYDFEYMFGDQLLIAPIVDHGSTVQAWIPPGTWFDFFTDEPHAGDKIVRLQSPLDELPVFARAGAVIPLVPDGDNVGTAPPAAIEWHVFPGADGRFVLYDDAGEGLGYAAGDYALTTVTYEDSPKPKLIIDAPRGAYRDHLVNRVHTVVFHDTRKLTIERR